MGTLQQHAKLVIPVALAVIVLAVASLFRDSTPPSIQYQIDLHYELMALGIFRVCETLPPDASVALLANQREVKKREFKGMVHRLKKLGLKVRHIEGISGADDEELEYEMGFHYEDFLRVAAAHPDLNAIVSLCGTPFWPEEATGPDPAALPDLLVTGDFERSRRTVQILEKEWVACALVPLEDPPMVDAPDAAQLLDRDYEMLYSSSRAISAPPKIAAKHSDKPFKQDRTKE